ncbi:lambda exonuclease family protein [Sphingobacterium mizutaii]|uniref:lambda exonuclease family protein n=1 Tax=Sphingobacterium mizutaii TaxID=1010 RepID=UPI00289D5854|nr:YqaJ viral recombinase family protein [Sphingobacterium mizutaii]
MEAIENAEELLQKSSEWHEVRKGKLTSSEHYRLVAEAKRPMTEEELKARPKGVTAKLIAEDHLLADGAITYIEEVIGEILTGRSADPEYHSKEREHGVFDEPQARKMYERVTGNKVHEVGIRTYSKYVAGSPDGLVEESGGTEFKCPYTDHNHVKNLRLANWQELKKERKEAYWQCISGMLINKRSWWDYISFSPFFPMKTCIKIIRIEREEVMEDLRLLAIKLKAAEKMIDEILADLSEQEELPW